MSPNDRKERLAIAVEDIESNGHLDLCQGRVGLDKDFVVEVVQRKDDNGVPQAWKVQAVEFTCTLLMAATVCDVIRDRDRKNDLSPTRLYIFRNKAWSKIPTDAVFTERTEDGSEIRLTPGLFPTPRGPVLYNAPVREKPPDFSFGD